MSLVIKIIYDSHGPKIYQKWTSESFEDKKFQFHPFRMALPKSAALAALIYSFLILSGHSESQPLDLKVRKVSLMYPIEAFQPVSGSYFQGLVSNDRLRCLSNRDYAAPTYRTAISCLVDLLVPAMFRSLNCENILGTRSVQVRAKGSIEVFKMTRFPEESNFNEYISVNATRWLELSQSDSKTLGLQDTNNLVTTQSDTLFTTHEITKFVPAEPVYLCVRANDWSGATHSTFEIKFHSASIRRIDKQTCRRYILIHIAFILLCASMYLLPYALAMSLGINVYYMGMKLYTPGLVLSVLVLFFCPLMLTSHNRYMARLYFKYFFTRSQAEETKKAIREKLPLFQSLFFSSALVVLGSFIVQLLYQYFGLDRELRNNLSRIILALATSWLVFFVARSFQRFVRNWIWILMSVILARSLNAHVNPMSRDEIVISILVATYVFKFLLKSTLRIIKKREIHINVLDRIISSLPTSLSFPKLLDWIFLSIQFYRGRKKSQVFHSNQSVHNTDPATQSSMDLSVENGQERRPILVKIMSNVSQLKTSSRRSDLALATSVDANLGSIGAAGLLEQEYSNSTEIYSYANGDACAGLDGSLDIPPRIDEQEEVDEADDGAADGDDDDDDDNGVFLEDIFSAPVESINDGNASKSSLSYSRPPSVSIFHRNRSGSNVEDKVNSGGTTPGSLHSARTATRPDRLEEDDFLANLQNSLYNLISADGDQLDSIALDQLVDDALVDDDLAVQEKPERRTDSEKASTRKLSARTSSSAFTSPRDPMNMMKFSPHKKISGDSLVSSNLVDKSKEGAFFDHDSELIVGGYSNGVLPSVISNPNSKDGVLRSRIIESLRSIERQVSLLVSVQDREDSSSEELPLILSSMNAATKLNSLLVELSQKYVQQQQQNSRP